MSHLPMMPQYQLLPNLITRKQHTSCSNKAFHSSVWHCASHTCRVLISVLPPFWKASTVIRDPIYFRGLFFNNILSVDAHRNCSNRLHEGIVDSSVLFYTVKNLLQPCQGHVMSRGIFAPHLGAISPPNHELSCPTDIFTDWLDYIHTSNCKSHFISYVNGILQNCQLSTKIYCT